MVSVFCSSGAVSGIRGKQMTLAVASKRSIFSKNHDYNSYIKSFPCHGEHVCTYRNSLKFRCKNIFVRRKHTKLFYSKFLLQRIFSRRIFRTKQMRVCSACSFRSSPDPGRLYMVGRMSICRYLKPIDGLPDPKGSLFTTIPSTAHGCSIC